MMVDEPPESGEPVAPPLTVPWSSITVLIVAFLIVAFSTMGSNSLRFDVWVSQQIQEWQNPFAQTLADMGNALGSKIVGIGLIIGAALAFASLKQWQECGFVVLLGIGRLLAAQLKGVFQNPRPTADQLATTGSFDGWGFPSGHVTSVTVTLGAIAWITARLYPRIDCRLIAAIWALGIVGTAWARIYVGAHWFSDTVGGALVGLILVATAANLSPMITRRM